MKVLSKIGIGLLLIINFFGCKKENEETIINNLGGPTACDTANMKYAVNILPVLLNNCYSCHGNGQQEGGVTLDGYTNLKILVDNKSLLNVITHTPGYSPMPQGLPQLSACEINKVKNWINNGAPNN